MTSYLRIRQKSKESKEIDNLGWGKFAEIRRRSPDQVFFANVIGLVGKGAVIDSRSRIFLDVFHIFRPDSANYPFQMYRTYAHTDTQTEKWTDL